MKAWIKYLMLAVVLLAVTWLSFWVLMPAIIPLGFSVWTGIMWTATASMGTASGVFGLCILYELLRMWYLSTEGRRTLLAGSWYKFKTWLGKDGL